MGEHQLPARRGQAHVFSVPRSQVCLAARCCVSVPDQPTRRARPRDWPRQLQHWKPRERSCRLRYGLWKLRISLPFPAPLVPHQPEVGVAPEALLTGLSANRGVWSPSDAQASKPSNVGVQLPQVAMSPRAACLLAEVEQLRGQAARAEQEVRRLSEALAKSASGEQLLRFGCFAASCGSS